MSNLRTIMIFYTLTMIAYSRSDSSNFNTNNDLQHYFSAKVNHMSLKKKKEKAIK